MDGMRFVVVETYDGVLSANKSGTVRMACNATLVEASFVGEPGDATLMLGTTADPDGFLTAASLAAATTEGLAFGRGNFNGALVAAGGFPRLRAGQAFTWTLDYNGAGGGAAEDVTLAFWFLEG